MIRSGPTIRGWGVRLQPYTVNNKFVAKIIKQPRTQTDSLDKRPEQRNIGMRFGL
jgi:hypothetical protein